MVFWRIFGLLAAALALASCASVETDSPVAGLLPSDYTVHGIDVSKYQGHVDWNQVRDSGVQFAWIKATEGARAAGIPRGAYHFMYWCRPWQEEVAWFEKNVPVEDDALPPVLDVELTPTSKTCRRTLYRPEVLEEMGQILAEMERHYGKKPVIYSTVDFYAGILQGGALNDYPIWVRSTKYHPSVKYADRHWHFWQYQSDAHIDGINGKVDRNAFFGSPTQWSKFVATGTLPLE
jgi:lysozyme